MNGRSRKPRIGLALGSGSARGWAHIGVIRTLEQAGIKPDLICGTSTGALVAAAYAAGELDNFEQWLLELRLTDVISLLDVNLNGGLIKGERLMEVFRNKFIDRPIDQLEIPYAAVATALHSGAEVWLREGSTIEAVRASIALPALFTPVLHDGRILVDGGLVNPVPVSLARAMGAELVIAVDLSADILGRHLRKNHEPESKSEADSAVSSEWMRKLQQRLSALMPAATEEDGLATPAMLDVIATSINIMQVRIGRSRMAGEPPDLIVTPRLSQLGLLEFHRGQEAIDEGKRAAQAALPALHALIDEFN